MPRYSTERRAPVLKKLLPPENRPIPKVAAELSEARDGVALFLDGVVDGLSKYWLENSDGNAGH